jgi:4-aminobutyrate aminotransferase-like enzyme
MYPDFGGLSLREAWKEELDRRYAATRKEANRAEEVVVHGEGCEVFDRDGRRYLDAWPASPPTPRASAGWCQASPR